MVLTIELRDDDKCLIVITDHILISDHLPTSMSNHKRLVTFTCKNGGVSMLNRVRDQQAYGVYTEIYAEIII